MAIHSLERIIPDEMDLSQKWSAETVQLHMERYQFASSFLKGDTLDMACGTGYGAYVLATEAEKKVGSITAVDIDGTAIRYAQQRYAHPLISFVEADAMTFGEKNFYDTVVSLETIEHLPHPAAFLKHLNNLLRADGKLICSVPVTPSVDANPYHLHDFTEKSFEQLLWANGFIIQQKMIQVQPFSLFSIRKKKEKRSEGLRQNLIGYYSTHPGSLIKRIYSTLRFGFTNRYLVVQCVKK